MGKELSDFDLDEIHNLVFRVIHTLLVNGNPKEQYAIWLYESTSGNEYWFSGIPTGKQIQCEGGGKPIKEVARWMPNFNDAGRILRRMVENTIAYETKNIEPKESESVPPDNVAEIDSEEGRPGVG